MIILVTGVSSGFGKAIAQALVANGHKVFGTVRRNVDPMEGVTYLQADVQDDSQIAASFDKMMKLTDGRMSGVSVSLIEPGDFSTGFTATRKSVDVEMASEAYPSYARSLASLPRALVSLSHCIFGKETDKQ